LTAIISFVILGCISALIIDKELMEVCMSAIDEKKITLNDLLIKEYIFISSEESLSDVIPIQWEEDVVNGKKKVTLVSPIII